MVQCLRFFVLFANPKIPIYSAMLTPEKKNLVFIYFAHIPYYFKDFKEQIRVMRLNESSVTPDSSVADVIEYINTYIKDKTLDEIGARFAETEWKETATATDAGDCTM